MPVVILSLWTTYARATVADTIHLPTESSSGRLKSLLSQPAGKNKMSDLIKIPGNEMKFSSLLRIDSLYLEYSGWQNNVTDSISFIPDASQMHSTRVQMNISVMKVPFSASYNYQRTNGLVFPGSFGIPVFAFDRDVFTRNISDRLRASFDVNNLVSERLAAIQNLKDIAIKDLATELIKVVKNYGEEFQKKVQELCNWKEIQSGDAGSFTRKLIGDTELRKLEDSRQTVNQLQENQNNGLPVDTAVFNRAMSYTEKIKGLQKAVSVIVKYKKKWDESGLVRTIKKMELEKDLQLQEMLSNPTVLLRLAKERLSLQKIEKLFLKVKEFEAGAGASQRGPMTLNESLRSSGFSLETIGNGSGSVFVTMGKLQELLSVTERSMAQGSFLQPATQMAGVSFGKQNNNIGGTGETYSRVSLFSFATSSQPGGLNPFSAIGGQMARNFVFTLSRKINIGSKGSLATEISKSATQEQSEREPGSGIAHNSMSASRLFNTGDFLSNLGVAVEYSNEFPDIQLDHELIFQYTGNGYSNQGNAYLLPGSKELNNSLKKSFFNRALTILVRNRMKSYDLNTAGRRVRNFSHVLDLRWKLNKSNYVSVKYQPASSSSLSGTEVLNKMVTTRLAADLNMAAKIKKMRVQNFLNLAYLSSRTMFYGSGEELYKTIQLNSTHNFSSGNHQFFTNTGFSYAFKNGSLPYLNSSLLVESGIVYDLFGGLNLSSALNYNAVQAWYSQVVFKQSVGGRIGKKFDLNLNIDMAKNLKVLQPYPVQSFRADINVRYSIL